MKKDSILQSFYAFLDGDRYPFPKKYKKSGCASGDRTRDVSSAKKSGQAPGDWTRDASSANASVAQLLGFAPKFWYIPLRDYIPNYKMNLF